MCILLLSTQHPDYSLILLSNRDEYLHRPTQRAAWWDSATTSHILGGRDLARPEKGTWLGITRQGKIAGLTNYREDSSAAAVGARSRGAMVNAFLNSPANGNESTSQWVQKLLAAEGSESITSVGGFSLLCGTIRPRQNYPGGKPSKPVALEPLAIISNRTTLDKGAHWICGERNEVYGLSNSLYDNPMPKVGLGKSLLSQTLNEAIAAGASESALIHSLFSVLSHDTLPVIRGEHTYKRVLDSLRHSIFIPALEPCENELPQKPETPRTLPKEPDTLRPNNILPTHTQHHYGVALSNGNLTRDEIESALRPPLNTRTADTDLVKDATEPTSPSSDSPTIYGTQKQTIILVDHGGHVKYIERTLYDCDARWVDGQENTDRDVIFEFDIEEWR